MQQSIKRPLILIILDGWGYSEKGEGNAIAAAQTPCFDRLWQNNPHLLLEASGLAVGLPRGQMGNSEVGHLHIGAGRQVLQDLAKLDLVVEDGSLAKNPVLTQAVDNAIATGKALHILGLLSNGGVHSRNTHLEALVELAVQRGLTRVYLHAFLDGRDTPPKSAAEPLRSMLTKIQQLGAGQIASIGGRYYGMDRDQRWERVVQAYDLLTVGKSDFHFADAEAALEAAYARGESDEFVKPTAIIAAGGEPITLQDGDSVIFANFRADRARELSYALTAENFAGFVRMRRPRLAHYVTMTEYAADLAAEVAYPAIKLSNIIGEVVADHGLAQLRIAETEKYAHVTYFINGGREEPFPQEDRIMVPSPKVATYDLQPEMSAGEVTDRLLAALDLGKYDLVICNYANPDMVGHTGDFKAAVQAVEVIDHCLSRVVEKLEELGGEAVIIADHGNAEQMVDPITGQPYTAHTTNLVPFIYLGRPAAIAQTSGGLVDIAPTLLQLLGISLPPEMTGRYLLKF